MNTFERWSFESSDEDVASLIKRSLTIKKQYEETIPDALSNIEKEQEIQKINQDKQHLIIEESLTKGTTVLLKVPTLILGKLEPKFRGPYTIESMTPKRNYFLKNKFGKILAVAYPLSKLKIVKDSEPIDIIFIGIDTVKKERIFNGTKEYLIKWRGLSEEENTWVCKSEISKEELDDYNKKKKPTDIIIAKIDSIKEINNIELFSIKKNFKIKRK